MVDDVKTHVEREWKGPALVAQPTGHLSFVDAWNVLTCAAVTIPGDDAAEGEAARLLRNDRRRSMREALWATRGHAERFGGDGRDVQAFCSYEVRVATDGRTVTCSLRARTSIPFQMGVPNAGSEKVANSVAENALARIVACLPRGYVVGDGGTPLATDKAVSNWRHVELSGLASEASPPVVQSAWSLHSVLAYLSALSEPALLSLRVRPVAHAATMDVGDPARECEFLIRVHAAGTRQECAETLLQLAIAETARDEVFTTPTDRVGIVHALDTAERQIATRNLEDLDFLGWGFADDASARNALPGGQHDLIEAMGRAPGTELGRVPAEELGARIRVGDPLEARAAWLLGWPQASAIWTLPVPPVW